MTDNILAQLCARRDVLQARVDKLQAIAEALFRLDGNDPKGVTIRKIAEEAAALLAEEHLPQPSVPPDLQCIDMDGNSQRRDQWCDRIWHCWHVADYQHTLDRHRDDLCCYCGATRCVTVPRPARVGRGGHGRWMHGAMVKDGE